MPENPCRNERQDRAENMDCGGALKPIVGDLNSFFFTIDGMNRE